MFIPIGAEIVFLWLSAAGLFRAPVFTDVFSAESNLKENDKPRRIPPVSAETENVRCLKLQARQPPSVH
jgi:hypothetical protein